MISSLSPLPVFALASSARTPVSLLFLSAHLPGSYIFLSAFLFALYEQKLQYVTLYKVLGIFFGVLYNF